MNLVREIVEALRIHELHEAPFGDDVGGQLRFEIADDDVIPKTKFEYYLQNIWLMVTPGLIWVSCCFCACQYQRSLALEAKMEAEERMGIELAEATANSFKDKVEKEVL